MDNGNGTVSDNATGLMWQQDTARDGGNYDAMTWEEALAYCEALNLGGLTDWRLPTIKELRSLVDYGEYNPAINKTFFRIRCRPITGRLLPMPAIRTSNAWYVYFRLWQRRLCYSKSL